MTIAKVTNKNTVAEIRAELTKLARAKVVKADAGCVEQFRLLKEATDNGHKPTKKELLALFNRCFTVVAAAEEAKKSAPKEAAPAKESSLKKKPAKGSTKSSEKAEEPKKTAKAKEEPKKTAPKGKQKAEAPKKPVEPTFPDEVVDADGSKYLLAKELNSYEAIKEAADNEEEIVIATHWTPAMLKTGQYGNGQITKKSLLPKKFTNDLDLLPVLYVCDGKITSNVIAISMYTECEYWFMPADFKKMVSNNLEFAVYRVEAE